MRMRRALLSVFAAAMLFCPGTAFASVPLAPSDVCQVAAELATSDQLPQRGLELLTQSKSEAACPQQWRSATNLVKASQVAADQAKKSLGDGDRGAAAALAADALAQDKENVTAAEVQAALAEPEGSTAQQIASSVSRLDETQFKPLGEVVVRVLLILASLLLVARLLPFLIGRWPRTRWTWLRATVLLVGLLACTSAALLLTLGSAGRLQNLWLHLTRTCATVTAAVLTLLGVYLVGWWLATRLRVSIAATNSAGDTDAATAAHVGALLSELGAAPPRGLEVPSGADTTELQGALSSIPGAGGFIVTLTQFAAGLLGVTPWRAEIANVDSGSLTVRIVRNGHPMGSTVIGAGDGRVDPVDSPAPEADLQRMAAAFILMKLNEHHRLTGLGGTRDWRSLGLHYIATADASLRRPASAAQQRATLRKALDLDPDNRLAQLAWQHSVWRKSTDVGGLQGYQTWLSTFLTDTEGDAQSNGLDPVRMRAAYTRAAVCLNLWAKRPDAQAADAYAAARKGFDELIKHSGDRLDPTFVARMTQVRESLPPTTHHLTQLPSATPGNTTNAIYNLACWYARLPGRESEAVNLLTTVADVNAVAAWMPDDPMLARLRQQPDYQNRFLADPREDFYELAPVAPFAEKLLQAGLGDVAVLNQAATSAQLMRIVPWPQRVSVVGLAELHESLRADPDMSAAAIEILFELCKRGLTTRTSLQAAPMGTVPEIHGKITDRCKPKKLGGFSLACFQGWWARQ